MWSPPWRARRLAPDDERVLVEAIARAEAGNRGEVQVVVSGRRHPGAPVEVAARTFDELGMGRTAEGTGVLLFVAERERQAAVFAGPGVHGAAEPEFWQAVIDAVADGYREGREVDGLSRALDRIGDLLRQVAPGEDTAGNELADRVVQS